MALIAGHTCGSTAGQALELFTCAPSTRYGAPSTNKAYRPSLCTNRGSRCSVARAIAGHASRPTRPMRWRSEVVLGLRMDDLLRSGADGNLGDRGVAVGSPDLEPNVTGRRRAEGADLHPAVGRPGPCAGFAEAAAIDAGEDPVRRDVAVPAALLVVIPRHDAQPTHVRLHAAEIQRDRLWQRPARLPHADEAVSY